MIYLPISLIFNSLTMGRSLFRRLFLTPCTSSYSAFLFSTAVFLRGGGFAGAKVGNGLFVLLYASIEFSFPILNILDLTL